MTYNYHPHAQRELDDAADYYDSIDLKLGDDFLEEIDGCISRIPAVLSAYETGEPGDVKNLVKALVVAFVRHNTIGGLENSRLESVIYNLAMELRETQDFQAAIDALRRVSPNDERFSADFAVASVPRRASARYLLKNLEYAMRATRELDVAPPNRVQVEHVYPQTPAAGERWPNHAATINRLGNLTLLARKLNAAIRNGNFAAKLPSYGRSELVLTQELLPYHDWNEANINARQETMSQLAHDIWSFPAREEAEAANANG